MIKKIFGSLFKFIFNSNFSLFEIFCFMLITPLIASTNNYWYFLLYAPVIIVSATIQAVLKD